MATKNPRSETGIIASAPAVFAKYGIKDSLALAHVMAQISHECGAGHDLLRTRITRQTAPIARSSHKSATPG
jgi:hypothetical protein